MREDTPSAVASIRTGDGWRWRLRAEGLYWLQTAALLLGVGLFKGINLLTLLGYALLAVAGLNLFVAGRRLKRLRGRRRLDQPVFAGAPCVVEVQVENAGRGALVGVRVEDRGEGHALSWFVARLEGHGRLTLRRQLVLPRRGRYAWGPVTAVSGYPFGLAERRRVLAPGEDVLVLPRPGWLHRGRFRHQLRSFDPRAERVRQRPVRHRAAQAELHGLRDYHPGDSPRSIHWRSSARRGELMVREFEDLPGDHLVLVFDPTPPAGAPAAADGDAPDARFEAAVSLAATVCWEWCRRRGDRLVAALAGPEPVVLDGLTGPAHARRVLEALAVQQPAPADAPALLARLRCVALPPAAVVVVAAGPSPLADALRRGLNRPVTALDASEAPTFDFYEPPPMG
jgi:uncharacterized protein (DUF58 family)